MNNLKKIEVIDRMLFIIKIFSSVDSKGVVTNDFSSGLCTIERQATAFMDLGCKESMEFNKFLQSNRPTMKNKWKEFADLERLKTAWWWKPYDFTQRILFLEALKQSLIK
jgi:hypothetical protein